MSSQRSVPLAVLFADVVGSTRLYEQLGDARARDTVARCIEVMKTATGTFGGKVVKTMGDEVLATFASASAAVDAASRMQLMIRETMADAGVPVDIRIGLHYGPVMEEEDDVFGSTVYTANRMTSQAKAGQIITTEATVQSLSPRQRERTRKIDVATVKGRRDGIALFEVLWEESEAVTAMVPTISLTEPGTRATLALRYHGTELAVDERRVPVTLGRSDDCDLTVRDTLISRTHAQIEYERGRFILVDQSTNGSCVIVDGGEEYYIRRDRMPLTGTGIIGLGRVARPDTVHTVAYAVREEPAGDDEHRAPEEDTDEDQT